MSTQAYIAISVFLAAYILISSEKIHRTKVAVFAAVLMIVFGIISQSQAVANIDFNTIFLLMGMMIIVNITRETGFFEYIAIKGVRGAKGRPWRLLVMFSLLTALVSAFLDNVTTVLLFTPIMIFIADALRVKVFPYLVALIISANIGGMATLIGAPPNIMIGTAAELTFNDFLIHIFPITILIFLANLGFLKLAFKKELGSKPVKDAVKMDPSRAIKDKKLLAKCLAVLAATILGFALHNLLGLHPATVAIAGASLLMLIVPGNPIEYLEKIEWNSLFFFAGLFIMVGGLETSGVIMSLFKWIVSKTDNVLILSGGLLWGGSLICSFLDNIPFTAMMIPLVEKLAIHLGDPSATKALWWAMAIGVNIGGNGTIIAASPNVVVSGIAEQSKHKITFGMYFKYGFLSVVMSAILGTIYVFIRYLI